MRVVCVLPGFVVTDGATAHLRHLAEQRGTTTDEVTRQIVDHLKVPLGRPGDPEDVAEMIAFLATSASTTSRGPTARSRGGRHPPAADPGELRGRPHR